MQKEPNLDQECSFFSAKRVDDILILSFKKGFLLHTTDLNARDMVLDYIYLVSKSDSTKVVVIIGSPDPCCKRDRYKHVG